MRRSLRLIAMLVAAFSISASAPLVQSSEPCAAPSAAMAGDTAQRHCCGNAGGFCGCARGKVRCCNGQVAAGCACRGDSDLLAAGEPREH